MRSKRERNNSILIKLIIIFFFFFLCLGYSYSCEGDDFPRIFNIEFV